MHITKKHCRILLVVTREAVRPINWQPFFCATFTEQWSLMMELSLKCNHHIDRYWCIALNGMSWGSRHNNFLYNFIGVKCLQKVIFFASTLRIVAPTRMASARASKCTLIFSWNTPSRRALLSRPRHGICHYWYHGPVMYAFYKMGVGGCCAFRWPPFVSQWPCILRIAILLFTLVIIPECWLDTCYLFAWMDIKLPFLSKCYDNLRDFVGHFE